MIICFLTAPNFGFIPSPIDCQIQSNRGVGTICLFNEVVGYGRVTSQITSHPITSFGQTITNRQVTSIKFDRSTFDQIPSAIFSHFGDELGGVRTVSYNTGKLYSINKSSFQNANNLTFLDIFNTKIGEILPRAFENARNLEEIHIRQCDVENLSVHAFAGLNNLRKVNLKGTKFGKYS